MGVFSPDRLERYKDFVDPERTGALYDPRKGLERLLGVLSPDPKGVLLVAMREDWYGSTYQLQSGVFSFLKELGLPSTIWPLALSSNWNYLERRDNGEIVDGSLVDLGAVVTKIEQDPSKRWYQRSLAGAQLIPPLVQNAAGFVAEAREYAERQKLLGKKPPKFVSMRKILGGVNSPTEQKRPLAVFDIINFLVHNPGKHRAIDLQDEIGIPMNRLSNILVFSGTGGIIDYISPLADKEGQPGRGWAVYTAVNPESAVDLDPEQVYQDLRNLNGSFRVKTHLTKLINYIKEHPGDEYEHSALDEKLGINSNHTGWILSQLAELGILQRPHPGFTDREVKTEASANDLSYRFYDLVLAPAKETADTLSALPLRSWNRQEVATYLQNYQEERGQTGSEEGNEIRSELIGILSRTQGPMKVSHIADLLNQERDGATPKDRTVGKHLEQLLVRGIVARPRLGYYSLVQK